MGRQRREQALEDLERTRVLLLGRSCAQRRLNLANPFRFPLTRRLTQLWRKPLDLQSEIEESIERARLACDETLEPQDTKFLVRVDDFPWRGFDLAQYREFHAIMEENSIPYLLAVTPRLAMDPLDPHCDRFRDLSAGEVEFIRNSSGSLELALHGLTHRVDSASEDKNLRSEFVGLPKSEVMVRLNEGLQSLKGLGKKVNIFVPPYNTFDFAALDVIKQYFRVVTGGPESIRHVGLRITPSILSGAIYVPSYPSAFGNARDVRKFVERAKTRRYRTILPLTLHWHWEVEQGYSDLRALARSIKGLAFPWSDLMNP